MMGVLNVSETALVLDLDEGTINKFCKIKTVASLLCFFGFCLIAKGIFILS